MKVAALVVAAGKGNRIGGDIPKQYLSLCGNPILYHTLKRLIETQLFDVIAIVVAEEWRYSEELAQVLNEFKDSNLLIVSGGKERADSVYHGLLAMKPLLDNHDLVMVHDGVRPFITASLINDLKNLAETHGSAIPVIPLKDSIRKREFQNPDITQALDRSHLVAVQTPQAFDFYKLLNAFELAGSSKSSFTDEASLYEHFVDPVKTTKGSDFNFKITTPFDLLIANALLNDFQD